MPAELYCFGFGLWKRGFVRAFLKDIPARVRFVRGPRHARLLRPKEGVVFLVWGRRDTPALRELAAQRRLPIWRMEDGFLRSVGLGTDFHVPSSLVIDKRGIYFDPRGESDLEVLLREGVFSEAELARASALRDVIVRTALTKYNFVGSRAPLQRPPDGRRVVLVPGQVEDDASIACGCEDVRTNLDLLEEARRARPEAYLIYKPHPDVLAGNRKPGVLTLERARELADAVVTDSPLPACLAIADEVHTMTSLVGFEALLRAKEVHCYGRPFYSGWGLTHDRLPNPRRTRRLSLDMLVAGALLRYPRYIRQDNWQLTSAEVAVAELRMQLDAVHEDRKLSRFEHRLRRMASAVRGMIRGRA